LIAFFGGGGKYIGPCVDGPAELLYVGLFGVGELKWFLNEI
jgi:hypothetical protein